MKRENLMGVAVLSFTAFAFSQVGTPGPANMAMLATGARFGFRAALPFVCGVVLGKQLIIWPMGLGIMQVADQTPIFFELLKYLSAGYVIWLAWRVANMSITIDDCAMTAPGFLAGLWIHPLNPKAWAMIIAGFTNFVGNETPALQATAIIAFCLFLTQLICHPIWTYFGDRITKLVAGKVSERYLMRSLAAITVLFVGFALFRGDFL